MVGYGKVWALAASIEVLTVWDAVFRKSRVAVATVNGLVPTLVTPTVADWVLPGFPAKSSWFVDSAMFELTPAGALSSHPGR